jgi:hypothetical protein
MLLKELNSVADMITGEFSQIAIPSMFVHLVYKSLLFICKECVVLLNSNLFFLLII